MNCHFDRSEAKWRNLLSLPNLVILSKAQRKPALSLPNGSKDLHSFTSQRGIGKPLPTNLVIPKQSEGICTSKCFYIESFTPMPSS